jgi:hypothetical protein
MVGNRESSKQLKVTVEFETKMEGEITLSGNFSFIIDYAVNTF